MSNFCQPIFSEPFGYLDVPDWSNNLVAPEPYWWHDPLKQATGLGLSVGISELQAARHVSGELQAAKHVSSELKTVKHSSGLTTTKSADMLISQSNVATSGLRPLVKDMPELVWNGTRILGTAQKTHTPGHVRQIGKLIQRMAQSGEYEYITMNRSWKVTTGLKDATGKLLPDIIGVRRSGVVDAFEVMSKSDNPSHLMKRLTDGLQSLPEHNRGAVKVIRYPYGS